MARGGFARAALAAALLWGTPQGLAQGGPGPWPAPRVPVAAPPPSALPGNARIARDILDLTFRLESERALPVLSRFEGAVRVRLVGGTPGLARDLGRLVARLRAEAGLDVTVVAAGPAEIVVEVVPAAEIAQAAPGAACFTVPDASGWAEWRAGPAPSWAGVVERRRAAVFLPEGAAPQEGRDCLHEEIAQALGPLDDLGRLAGSVFNDDNVQGLLTGFDMLVLRALHDPALHSGMSEAEVAARLPGVLWRLHPEGGVAGRVAGGGPAPGPGGGAEVTRGAGRPEAADAADPLHAAQAGLRAAVAALRAGNGAGAARIAALWTATAEAHGDARLLATLLFVEARGLGRTGDAAGAAKARLDGLGWARYGFGDAGALARMRQVEGLPGTATEGGA